MIKFDNTMNELYDNDPNLSMHSENNEGFFNVAKYVYSPMAICF